MQKALSAEQVEAFYHNEFVADQVRHFGLLFKSAEVQPRLVVDMGGGCGFFARKLREVTAFPVQVVDMDPASVAACLEAGIDASVGDALQPQMSGREDIVSFNLILHHLVSSSEPVTRGLQMRALSVWRGHVQFVFVNEYIYESFVGHLSGWLIYRITKSTVLSAMAKYVSRVVPSLRANTFGVGVRFRAHDEWRRLFDEAGFEVVATERGMNEPVSLPRRVLFIREIRRDSFVLRPKLALGPASSEVSL